MNMVQSMPEAVSVVLSACQDLGVERGDFFAKKDLEELVSGYTEANHTEDKPPDLFMQRALLEILLDVVFYCEADCDEIQRRPYRSCIEKVYCPRCFRPMKLWGIKKHGCAWVHGSPHARKE